MRKNGILNTAVLGCVLVLSLLSSPVWADAVADAAEHWKQMRVSDVNSAEFAQARRKLLDLIPTLSANQKVPVATELMQRGADDATNATALGMFGIDGLPLSDIKGIFDNPNRTWPQRVLVRTYFRFCRPENETRLSEPARRKLVGMLADRLTVLAAQGEVDYGEQRLMHHALEAILSRYAGKQDSVVEMGRLLQAMKLYTAGHSTDDVLSLTLAAWSAMNDNPKPPVDSEKTAMMAMGHWEPLVRIQAAVYLGSQIRKDPGVGQRVLDMLNDPRDEVRASAARVFSFALSYKPQKVIPTMVDLLVHGRGVTVQKAASETLIWHSEEAQVSIDLLLEALNRKTNKPGPKRTTSILVTLSYLIHDRTARSQRQKLLEAAVDNLGYAPRGALRAMEALGPYAKPAVPNIKNYRDTKADRFTRQYIDRHVLQAIISLQGEN